MKTRRWWILAGIAILTVGIIYYFADPMESRWMPRCLLHTLTGYECPGCGAQRMAHSLLHGNLRQAWEANPFLLCILPIIPIGIWGDLRPGIARRIFYHPLAVWILTASIILWGIIRNFL